MSVYNKDIKFVEYDKASNSFVVRYFNDGEPIAIIPFDKACVNTILYCLKDEDYLDKEDIRKIVKDFVETYDEVVS